MYKIKKQIPALCGILLGSSLLYSSLGSVEATYFKDTDIKTVNVFESEGFTGAKTGLEDNGITEEIKATLEKNDISVVTLNSTGVEVGEMLAQPPVVVLDSNAVPDGEGVCDSANKTWMSYTAVTNRSSAQWKLLRGSSAYTDTTTGLRMVDERYCIAVGSFYCRTIGTKVNLVMENGSIVECIVGDQKADRHTDPTNRYQAQDGSVVEMIVDRSVFRGTDQYPAELSGRISRIEIVE